MSEQAKKNNPKILGLRTVVYYVRDLQKARMWYTDVLGMKPYFDEPFYVGFNVGGYELGLHPDGADRSNNTGGISAYWGVEDAEEEFNRLLALGASPFEKVQDVGEGIKVGVV